MSNKRPSGRAFNQMRPVTIKQDVYPWAAGSLSLSYGNTTVFCAINVQKGVPPFLRGSGKGWLAAEYAMLPAATATRSSREAVTGKRNGRSVEIGRLIGRCLRSVVDLSALGEQTIVVDCDVVCADGGTRTASITAASLVLRKVQDALMREGAIQRPFIRENVCAISVGITGDAVLLDPDYQEDQQLCADFNFVMTTSGDIVEIQGNGEKGPVSWQLFDEMRVTVVEGVEYLANFFEPLPEVSSTKTLLGGLTIGERLQMKNR